VIHILYLGAHKKHHPEDAHLIIGNQREKALNGTTAIYSET
jgi:hypothetical protein